MPLVIPIFIPHEGCPHCCVFCNQRSISGFLENPVTPADVQTMIRTWLDRRKKRNGRVQVAFYGGSFTGLGRARQDELLGAVAPFVKQGRVAAIRLSTRPDYMDRDIAAFLRNHHVSVVELGVQSLDDTVLKAARRGHDRQDVRAAVAVLRESGMEIGIQLMLGLPADTRRTLMDTVKQVIELRPDFVRIYPVLVVENSGLAALYRQGQYRPLSLEMAVLLAAWMKKRFDETGIRVVRMGLQAGLDLEQALVAGPWHPAFGELVNSRLMLQQTRKLLASVGADTRVCLTIHEKDQSTFRGMHSKNIQRLQELGLWPRITLATGTDQPRGTVHLHGIS